MLDLKCVHGVSLREPCEECPKPGGVTVRLCADVPRGQVYGINPDYMVHEVVRSEWVWGGPAEVEWENLEEGEPEDG